MKVEVSRKCSFFMFLFIMVVVLFHSNLRYYYSFIEDLTAVSTAYFFMVSAYFFYKDLNTENFVERLKKRFVTLLVPYFLWNTIYMILYSKTHNFSISYIIEGFTTNPICTPTWYLFTLFLSFMFAPIIKRAFSKVNTTFLLMAVMSVLSYLVYIKYQGQIALIPMVGGYLIRCAEYIIPYLLGGIIGSWFQDKIYVSGKRSLVGIISSLIVMVVLAFNIPSVIRWLLWMIFPIVLWQAIPEKIFRYTGFFKIFTDASFLINTMHCYFLYLWYGILAKRGFIMEAELSLVVVILAVVFSYVVYYLLKLFAPGVLKILTGNRIPDKNADL